MTIAAIITAYKRPDLLAELVSMLGPWPIAIHIDRKSPEVEALTEGANAARAEGVEPITFLPRQTCHWGLFGLVRATIEGLRWFVKSDASHAFVLTGQCAPIGPVAAIEAAVSALGDRSVIEAEPFPLQRWEGHEEGGWRRIDRFYFPFIHPGYKLPISKRLWRRTVPYGLHPWGGSGYFCIARTLAQYVIDYIDSHPALERYFKWTFVPDETFFQTIVMNSPLAETVIPTTTHYIDWPGGSYNPKLLGPADLPAIAASGKLFARKFDDVEIMRAVADLSPARRAFA